MLNKNVPHRKSALFFFFFYLKRESGITLTFAFERSRVIGYKIAERFRFKNLYLDKYQREMSVKGKKVISL